MEQWSTATRRHGLQQGQKRGENRGVVATAPAARAQGGGRNRRSNEKSPLAAEATRGHDRPDSSGVLRSGSPLRVRDHLAAPGLRGGTGAEQVRARPRRAK